MVSENNEAHGSKTISFQEQPDEQTVQRTLQVNQQPQQQPPVQLPQQEPQHQPSVQSLHQRPDQLPVQPFEQLPEQSPSKATPLSQTELSLEQTPQQRIMQLSQPTQLPAEQQNTLSLRQLLPQRGQQQQLSQAIHQLYSLGSKQQQDLVKVLQHFLQAAPQQQQSPVPETQQQLLLQISPQQPLLQTPQQRSEASKELVQSSCQQPLQIPEQQIVRLQPQQILQLLQQQQQQPNESASPAQQQLIQLSEKQLAQLHFSSSTTSSAPTQISSMLGTGTVTTKESVQSSSQQPLQISEHSFVRLQPQQIVQLQPQQQPIESASPAQQQLVQLSEKQLAQLYFSSSTISSAPTQVSSVLDTGTVTTKESVQSSCQQPLQIPEQQIVRLQPQQILQLLQQQQPIESASPAQQQLVQLSEKQVAQLNFSTSTTSSAPTQISSMLGTGTVTTKESVQSSSQQPLQISEHSFVRLQPQQIVQLQPQQQLIESASPAQQQLVQLSEKQVAQLHLSTSTTSSAPTQVLSMLGTGTVTTPVIAIAVTSDVSQRQPASGIYVLSQGLGSAQLFAGQLNTHLSSAQIGAQNQIRASSQYTMMTETPKAVSFSTIVEPIRPRVLNPGTSQEVVVTGSSLLLSTQPTDHYQQPNTAAISSSGQQHIPITNMARVVGYVNTTQINSTSNNIGNPTSQTQSTGVATLSFGQPQTPFSGPTASCVVPWVLTSLPPTSQANAIPSALSATNIQGTGSVTRSDPFQSRERRLEVLLCGDKLLHNEAVKRFVDMREKVESAVSLRNIAVTSKS